MIISPHYFKKNVEFQMIFAKKSKMFLIKKIQNFKICFAILELTKLLNT